MMDLYEELELWAHGGHALPAHETIAEWAKDAKALQQRVEALEHGLIAWHHAWHSPTPSPLGRDECGLCDLRRATETLIPALIAIREGHAAAQEQGEG